MLNKVSDRIADTARLIVYTAIATIAFFAAVDVSVGGHTDLTPELVSYTMSALPEGGADQMIVEIPEDGPVDETTQALRDAGFVGIPGDGRSAIYVPYGTVFDTPTFGPMRVTYEGFVSAAPVR